MTIASTRDTKITVDALVVLAHKRAGIMDAAATATEADNVAKVAYGRMLLSTIISEMGGFQPARSVDFYHVTLVADQQTYTLPEEIVQVLGQGAYIPASETDIYAASGETPVMPIGMETWQRLSDKASSGTPTMMFVRQDKDSYQLVVYLYQRPSEAGTLRLQAQYAPADVSSGAATIDLRSSYNQYLLHELAGQLLSSANGEEAKVNALLGKAAMLKADARREGASQAPVPFQITIQEAQRR